MISFGNKINRSYSLYLPFRGNFTIITTYFSKSNTYIAFVTEQSIMQACKNGELNSQIYRDLRQSSFASTFLDIRDLKSSNLDIRCQFSNILPNFKDKIQYFSNETIKLSKVQTSNGPFESVLYLYVFGFSDYPDDFIYCLAERQHIDTVIGKKLVRTSAIQISTKDCLENMNKMVSFYNGKTNRELKQEFSDIEDTMKEVLN